MASATALAIEDASELRVGCRRLWPSPGWGERGIGFATAISRKMMPVFHRVSDNRSAMIYKTSGVLYIVTVPHR